MEKKYRGILEQCREATSEFQVSAINEILDTYEMFLFEENTRITFVEVGGDYTSLARIAGCLCGKDVLTNCLKSLRHKNEWCICLEYGEKTALYAGEILDELKVDAEQLQDDDCNTFILTIPMELLQNKTVILLNAGSRELANAREIAASEEIYLLTSAAMAMTGAQKSWIADYIQEYFDNDRFYVCLTGIELLQDEAQETQVIAYVNDCLSKYSGVRCIRAERDIADKIQSVNEEYLKERSQRRMIQNMIHEIMKILEYELRGLKVSEEQYIHIENQLEKYRSQLVTAGKITAESVLDNQINAIINAVYNSAEEYGDAIYDSIRDAIMTAKDIEEVENRICSYIECSWEYFARETSTQIAKDFADINSKIIERMEEDVCEMMKHMDVSEQSLLEYIMDFDDKNYVFHVEFDSASDDALRKVSKNARNMMLLSIPLLFVSPTLSVTALVGGGIYSHLGKKTEDRKYREELLSHVREACQETKRDAIQGFTDTLNAENTKMKKIILQGYQNLVDLLKEELEKKRKMSAESAELAANIQRVLTIDMPSLLNDSTEEDREGETEDV